MAPGEKTTDGYAADPEELARTVQRLVALRERIRAQGELWKTACELADPASEHPPAKRQAKATAKSMRVGMIDNRGKIRRMQSILRRVDAARQRYVRTDGKIADDILVIDQDADR